ncbi:DUF2274 domain-containing protein [Novosphingobium sp.]|uniref:DUF2274 domain-containing protein n=1 Tax=Novosphingobium sp. TaxID=1874826 RepID=UPI0031CF1E27
MVELKLGKLPERVPVKLTISVLPDLNRRLLDYAAVYADAYGQQEPLLDLIPAMLVAFLDGDRAFAKAQTVKGRGGPRDA